MNPSYRLCSSLLPGFLNCISAPSTRSWLLSRQENQFKCNNLLMVQTCKKKKNGERYREQRSDFRSMHGVKQPGGGKEK